MKKILTVITMVATTTLLQAQGWLSFTSVGSAIKTNSALYTVQSGGTQANAPTVAAGGLFYYALLYSTTPLTGATNANWQQVLLNGSSQAVMATNNAVAGAEQSVNNGQFQSALTAGTTYSVAVAGWSASLGNNWTTVSAELDANNYTGNWAAPGFFGFLNGGSLTPASSSPGSAIFPTIFPNGSLVLYAVPTPEPTTIALAGLGGLSMLLFRRRKS